MTLRAVAATPWLAVALAALSCTSGAPLPEVKVHASVSPVAAQALVTLSVNRRLARVVLVDDPAEADLAWFGDPVQALRHARLLVPGSAPDASGVAARWKDPARRFFPVGARARILVVDPRASLPVQPRNLRDLADPRLAGLQALARPDQGEGPATFAALALLSSDDAALGLARAIAAQRPAITLDGPGVQALVATGKAAFGLAGSEQGAAGAVSVAALEVVYPDQSGFGTLVFPTAAAVLQRGVEKPVVHALAEWLSGSDAEQLLVARTPGLMPLRVEVPVPPGVRSARDLRSPVLDWERLSETEKRLTPQLGLIFRP
ncbi:MAG: ABC transporter substrate-binding protein [Deltaproteobacteria bacterium]